MPSRQATFSAEVCPTEQPLTGAFGGGNLPQLEQTYCNCPCN